MTTRKSRSTDDAKQFNLRGGEPYEPFANVAWSLGSYRNNAPRMLELSLHARLALIRENRGRIAK